jgi:hypothetical protein
MGSLIAVAILSSFALACGMPFTAISALAAAAVISNFKQAAKEAELQLYPLVPRLVDRELLESVGATAMGTAT